MGVPLPNLMQREEVPPAPPPVPSRDPDAFILEFLRDHELHCPLCGYNLRNITLPRCPECGRALKLAVGMVDPYVVPWVLTTIFVAMAGSVGIIFILACIMEGPPRIPPADILPRLVPLMFGVGYGLLAIPLALALIAARRRFWKLERRTQILLAIAAFAINAILLLGGALAIHG